MVSGVLGRNVAIHNEDGLSIHHLFRYGGGSCAIENILNIIQRNVQQIT